MDKPYVLIVEDEDSIRVPLKEYLVQVGMNVLVASDGVGAIKHILDYSISVIVTDYRMENLGGDYWLRFLKRFCPDSKVIITSGFIHPDMNITYDVFLKPYSFQELAEKVRSFLN